MSLADFESTEMNEVLEEKTVDALIEYCKTDLQLRNVADARQIIKSLMSIVTSKNKEIFLKNKEIERKMKLIAAFEQRAFDQEHFYLEEQRLRKFYQKIVLKHIRDLDLLKDKEEAKDMFDKVVHEKEDDLNY